jgi:hypothetical protein
MKEVSIHLRPIPSSHWVTNDWGCMTSVISIESEAQKHAGPLAIVGVYLEGLPLRHRVMSQHTVAVEPMLPLRGGYLEVRCLTPRGLPPTPAGGSQSNPAPLPLPDYSYGLTAPSRPSKWHSQ